MAARTGLQAAVRLCQKFCNLLARWKPSIVTAINASSLSSGDKTACIATLDALEASCDAFRLLANKMEK